MNMAPSQTIKWIESGKNPSQQNVEIEGTEPYIVGGHTASGYWVDTKRATTVNGLFAGGDVAGGAPQKYVTGALAEGEIAALSAVEYVSENGISPIESSNIDSHISEVESFLTKRIPALQQNNLKKLCRALWIPMQAVLKQIIVLMRNSLILQTYLPSS